MTALTPLGRRTLFMRPVARDTAIVLLSCEHQGVGVAGGAAHNLSSNKGVWGMAGAATWVTLFKESSRRHLRLGCNARADVAGDATAVGQARFAVVPVAGHAGVGDVRLFPLPVRDHHVMAQPTVGRLSEGSAVRPVARLAFLHVDRDVRRTEAANTSVHRFDMATPTPPLVDFRRFTNRAKHVTAGASHRQAAVEWVVMRLLRLVTVGACNHRVRRKSGVGDGVTVVA